MTTTTPTPQRSSTRRLSLPRMLRRRVAIPLVFALLGLAVAGAQIATEAKTFVATAQVFVTPSTVKDASGLFSGNQFALAKVQSYVDVVNSPTITSQVRRDENLGISDRALAGKITADAPLTQSLLNIHVSDSSPSRAARIANSVATNFVTYARRIDTEQVAIQENGQLAKTSTPVLKLTVVHPATVPTSSNGPRKAVVLLVGLLAGLVVGLIALIIRERVDTRVRTARDVDNLVDNGVSGVIPSTHRPFAFGAGGGRGVADAYRLLRTNLLFSSGVVSTRTVAVTSPSGGEGRTSVALNLAYALAESGSSVCLLEADLRNPQLAASLGLDARAPGAAALLAGTSVVDDVVSRVDGGIDVVVVGALPADPHRLLNVDRVRDVLQTLASRYDVVVVDTPPLLTAAGGAEIVSVADATLLVLRAGRTDRDATRRAATAISRTGALAGVVLVGASDSSWQRDGAGSRPSVDGREYALTGSAGTPAARLPVDELWPQSVTVHGSPADGSGDDVGGAGHRRSDEKSSRRRR